MSFVIGAVAIVFLGMGVLALVQPRAIGRFFQVRCSSRHYDAACSFESVSAALLFLAAR